MIIKIDPQALSTPKSLHEHLKRALDMPDYYGMNLDALADVLSVTFRPVVFWCLRYDDELNPLYPHAEPFFRVITDCAQRNHHLIVDDFIVDRA